MMEAKLRRRRLALADPLATADGQIEQREMFVVRIERGGVAGIGEATPLPGWTESVEDCRSALEAAVDRLQAGRAEAAIEEVEDRPAARHALRLAGADRAAREVGVSVARYLGDTWARDSVPVNATVGDGSVEETVNAAERAVDQGFDAVKVKVGARDLAEDLRRVDAVRAAVGPAVTVRADANGAWDRETAGEAIGALREFRVSYVEQPLPADDLEGLSELRNRGVGVAVDETLRDHEVSEVLAAGAADAVVLKPMVQGGPGATVSAAREARNNGVDPVVTTTVDGAIARTGAVHCAAAVPVDLACGLATAERLASDLGPDPAPVRDGSIDVPDAPGLAGNDVVEAWWSE